jgi:hypothetical protein
MTDVYDSDSDAYDEGPVERRVPCNQVSLVLHDHDLLNTCCFVNPGCEDEYNSEARSLQTRVREGQPVQEALRATLIEWFGETLLGDRNISALSDDLGRVFKADRSLKPVLVADMEHREELLSPENPSVFSQARFVTLPENLVQLSIADQADRIRSLIQEHHHINQGELESCGKILRYMFFDADGTATQYAVDGSPGNPGNESIP